MASTSKAYDNNIISDRFTLVSSLRKRKTPQNAVIPYKERKVVLESETSDTASVLSDQTSTSNRYESLLQENVDSPLVAEVGPQNVMEENCGPPPEKVEPKTSVSPSCANDDKLHWDLTGKINGQKSIVPLVPPFFTIVTVPAASGYIPEHSDGTEKELQIVKSVADSHHPSPPPLPHYLRFL